MKNSKVVERFILKLYAYVSMEISINMFTYENYIFYMNVTINRYIY